MIERYVFNTLHIDFGGNVSNQLVPPIGPANSRYVASSSHLNNMGREVAEWTFR
jgi:hypothetical protein